MTRIPNTYSHVELRRALRQIASRQDATDGGLRELEDSIGEYPGDALGVAMYLRLEGGGYLLKAEGGKILLHLATIFEWIDDASESYYELEAAEAIGGGMPVYGLSGLPQVGLARADELAKSHVRGLATMATDPGHSCRYVARGRVVMADWTSVIGSAELTPSARYYLDPTGGLTTVPTTTGGHCLVVIGEAIDTLVLDLSIQPPIYL